MWISSWESKYHTEKWQTDGAWKYALPNSNYHFLPQLLQGNSSQSAYSIPVFVSRNQANHSNSVQPVWLGQKAKRSFKNPAVLNTAVVQNATVVTWIQRDSHTCQTRSRKHKLPWGVWEGRVRLRSGYSHTDTDERVLLLELSYCLSPTMQQLAQTGSYLTATNWCYATRCYCVPFPSSFYASAEFCSPLFS